MTPVRRIGARADFSSVGPGALVAWYLLWAAALFALPSVLRVGAPWTRPATEEVQAWTWLVAFLLAAMGIVHVRATRGKVSLPALFGCTTLPWIVGFLALMLRDGISHSRSIALLSVVMGNAILVAPALWSGSGAAKRGKAIVLAFVGVAVLSAVLLALSVRRPATAPAVSDRVMLTALEPIRVRYAMGLVGDSSIRGGAFASLGRNLLLVTGSGTWHEISWDDNGQLHAARVPLPVPMNREHAGRDLLLPLMRVTGLAVSRTADSLTIYVSHEVWQPDPGCVVLQVSFTRLKDLTSAERATWTPLYATQPCLTPVARFGKEEMGGRLLLQEDGSLLLSVADYGLGKIKPALAQLPAGDYGKIIRIAPNGARTLLTMGHRNPSGLAADADGNIWSVEHGPKGGDEVNLLQPGANYGWPLTTYGTDYGAFSWPIAMPADSSNRFTSPAFVLVPSVGISSLIVIRGTGFQNWAGDLLAGSLRGNKLIRFRREGRRLVYAELLEINRRIRDLAETHDGHIVLYTDEHDLVLLSVEPEIPDLSVTFGQCWQCHTLPNEDPPARPNLVGIVGRRVASDSGFKYSEALKRVGGSWTEERLDAFLASPSGFAPGTTMSFAGITDSTERRAVIALLKREFARKMN